MVQCALLVVVIFRILYETRKNRFKRTPMLNGVLTCNLGFGIETIRCKDNRENTSDISLSYVYGNVSAIITSLITHNNLPPLVS